MARARSGGLGVGTARGTEVMIMLGELAVIGEGAGAVDERQAFNSKTPVGGCIFRVDIAAFMLEMQLAFPQQLQR